MQRQGEVAGRDGHSTWGGILGANGKRVEERPMKDTENSPQDEKQGP